MTILIRELVIKAEVTEKRERAKAEAAADPQRAREARVGKFSDHGGKQRRER